MVMQRKAKRPIGRILLDGGFLSQGDLRLALEEQKKTNERLGQVLIRLGMLEPADVNAVLAVQDCLEDPETAITIAAGMRTLLGALLLQAGVITNDQLDQAIAEQRRTGERLGSVLVRRHLVTEQQLSRLLEFQRSQGAERPAPGPLRLGELLVLTETITRSQLEDALRKQAVSRKKLGEVLIEEGYAEPRQIRRGIRLQQMLQTAVLVAVLAIGTMACGSGGGGGAPAQGAPSGATTATTQPSTDTRQYANSWVLTLDEYGLQNPTFYYSTSNESFWSIQANIAESVWDPNFKTIMRVDILKSAANGTPSIGGKTYAIEAGGMHEKFPGEFLVFNGQRSVLKKVESGTISFTPASTLDGEISGEFDVMLTDYDSPTSPPPHYHLKGTFDFRMGTCGPAGS